MSGRNLLGLPERHSILPDGLETESGIHCGVKIPLIKISSIMWEALLP